MVYCTCSNCSANLEIDEDDYFPGCRDHENVKCPQCGEIATSVFTSGIPAARVTNISAEDMGKFFFGEE